MGKEMISRDLIESLIVSCCYKDITLSTEVSEYNFSNNKTFFYLKLLKEICKSAKEIDELTVRAWCEANNLFGLYTEYGGYESIKNLRNMDSKVANFDSYMDSLNKLLVLDSYKHLQTDFNKEFEVEGRMINPIDVMPMLTSNEFSELMMSIVIGNALKIETSDYVCEQLFYTEEEMYEKLNDVKSSSISFDVTMRYNDIDKNEERFIQSFKILNDICRIRAGEGNIQISGFSGVGKSTLLLNILLGLATSGRKSLLVSNENTCSYFKDMLTSYIANNIFKCYTMSRKKISNNLLNEEEKKVLIKTQEFIKERYEDRILFLAVSDFDMPKIFKYTKRLNMLGKCDVLCIDTMKPDGSSLGSTGESALNMVKISRDLDKFSREFNDENKMLTICTSQIATYAEGSGMLNASLLSNSKATKEVAGALWLVRKVYSGVELDKDNAKYFLKPFVWKYDEIKKKSVKKYLKITKGNVSTPWDKTSCDMDGTYILLFIDKSRFGSSGEILLYQVDMRTSRIYEKGLVEQVYNGKIVGA